MHKRKESLFNCREEDNLKKFKKLKQFKRTKRTTDIYDIRKGSSSEEEHKVNALALGADEGRDKLR